jgi:hypothetical protein
MGGSSNYNNGRGIAADNTGSVITVGEFGGSGDFNPGSGTFNMTSAGGEDIFISKVDSQGNFKWAKRIGSTGNDRANAVTVDKNKFIYITGYFAGTVDFDPDAGIYWQTGSTKNLFVLKLDSNGAIIWSVAVNGSGNYGNAIALDTNGNVFTTGVFTSTCDFDPSAASSNLTAVAGPDVFIYKLTSTGNFGWAKAIGGTGSESGNALTLDFLGNIYITGTFSASTDFDPGSASYYLGTLGGTDVFICRLSSSGNFNWAKKIGGFNNDAPYAIILDDSLNLYVTGSYELICDFDPSNQTFTYTAAGSGDIFIEKLDSGGVFKMARSMGGGGNDIGYGICRDKAGYIYITGVFTNNADFDPGSGSVAISSAGGNDIFVSKLDPAGGYFTVDRIGSSNHDNAYAMINDLNGNLHITGSYTGNVDFDPGFGVSSLNGVGLCDIFVLKLRSCSGPPSSASAFNGPQFVCHGATKTYSVVNYTGSTSFAWTVPTGAIILSGQGSNSVNVTFGNDSGNVTAYLTNPCGTTTRSKWVNVQSDAAKPDTIIGKISVCMGVSETYSVTNGNGLAYYWTLPNGWTGNSNTNTITVTPGLGPGVISVYSENVCGVSSPTSLNVNAITNPDQPDTVHGSNLVCSGVNYMYYVNPVQGATSYTWTLPSGWTGASSSNSIIVTANGNGGKVIVMAENQCGFSPAQSITVYGSSIPAKPANIIGDTIACSGTPTTFSVNPVQGATSYIWTVPSGWVGMSQTNSINLVAGSNGGIITCQALNACGNSAPERLSVMVHTYPAKPGSISGNTAICGGSSQTYSIAPVNDAISYTWILPSGWTGTSLTSSINTVAGNTGGTLKVIANNGCGSSPAQLLNISVYQTPTVSYSISPSATICAGTPIVLKGTGATSYSWSNGVTDGVPFTPVASGSYILTGTNGGVCADTAIVYITVKAKPVVTSQPADQTLYIGDQAVFQVTASGGTASYQWQVNAGAGFTNLSNSAPYNGTNTGTLTISNTGYDLNYYRYRCKLISATTGCEEITKEAILIVKSKVGINHEEGIVEDIFPNPFQENVIIRIKEPADFMLVDGGGRTILSGKLGEKNTILDLKELSPGIYFLKTRNSVYKLVKR